MKYLVIYDDLDLNGENCKFMQSLVYYNDHLKYITACKPMENFENNIVYSDLKNTMLQTAEHFGFSKDDFIFPYDKNVSENDRQKADDWRIKNSSYAEGNLCDFKEEI